MTSNKTTKNHLIFSVRNLNWNPNGNQILNDISFDISAQEKVGIVGPNGAGKTSVLNCLLGQTSLRSGEVLLKQKTLQQYTRKQVAQLVSVVHQQKDVTFSLSVFEVVRMGLLPYKTLFSTDTEQDINRIDDVLIQVGMFDFKYKNFNLLSGGGQQRVLIARALLQRGEVLIMDEPINHLDIYYQHQVLSLVNQLDICVIMSIHDINLAANYCSRIILLSEGKLIDDGSPEQVFTKKNLENTFGLSCHVGVYNDKIHVQFQL